MGRLGYAFSRCFLTLGASVSAFLFLSSSWALPIPPVFRQLVVDENREELIEKFEAIPVVSPEEFLNRVGPSNLRLLGNGFNGVALTDELRVVKILQDVFKFHADQGGAWQGLQKYRPLAALIPSEETAPKKDRIGSLNEHVLEKETLGSLLWALVMPGAERDFPDLVSSDGMAQRIPLVEGQSLDKVLAAERRGEKPLYDPAALWREITEILNRAERLLFRTGVTVDILNSANFLVSGSYKSPVVRLIDRELVQLSPEGYEYYEKRGFVVPRSLYATQRKLVYWPLFPDHVVFSNLWRLSLEQSLTYVRVRYGFSKDGAAEYLSRVPKLPINFVTEQLIKLIQRREGLTHQETLEFLRRNPKILEQQAPNQTNFSNIERALCSDLLNDAITRRYDRS